MPTSTQATVALVLSLLLVVERVYDRACRRAERQRLLEERVAANLRRVGL